MAKLKVFVVPIGFHDAYVAAPSRAAALRAWGSEHDLFARGVASEVTDPALTAEPLAHPGQVIKRSRGTAAEQIAALPPDTPRADAKHDANEAPRRASGTVRKKPAKPRPKPSRDALDAAERALEEAETAQRAESADLAARLAELDRERRRLTEAHDRARRDLDAALDTERDRYDRAIAKWRAE